MPKSTDSRLEACSNGFSFKSDGELKHDVHVVWIPFLPECEFSPSRLAMTDSQFFLALP